LSAWDDCSLIGISVAGEEAGTGSEEEEEEDGVFSDDEGIEKDHDDSTGNFNGKVSRDFLFCFFYHKPSTSTIRRGRCFANFALLRKFA
jgi:hypothetical protein